MHAPFFSITVPVYNAAPYLDWAIAGLLQQDHRHFEIVAIDDGSTDTSLEILERHARSDPRLRLVAREHRGLVATRNEALRLAQADLVAVMDADDISYPSRLSRQAAAFAADPGLALCGTDYDEIVGSRLYPSQGRLALDRHDPKVLSLFFSLFTHSTTAFNRKVIEEDDFYYDPAYPCAEDFELIRRIAAKYRVAYIPTPLVAYRIHSAGTWHRHGKGAVRLHLRLVAENLKRDLSVDTAPLDELGGQAEQGRIARALVGRVGRCLLEIERVAGRAGAGKLPSYRVGIGNLFHDLYGVLREHDPALLCAFLDEAGKWPLVPRRDRLWLRIHSRSRLLGNAARQAVEMAAAAARRRASLPAASVLPRIAAPTRRENAALAPDGSRR